MSSSKNKFQDKNLQDLERLLNQQTMVILGAVDKKISILDKRMDARDLRLDNIEKKLERFEERINKKIDRLATLIDKFVNLYTKQEQEFKIMKYEINQIKKVIKEKLGVEIA